MSYVKTYRVIDNLRNRSCNSLKEAHVQYMPQVSYFVFSKMIKNGGLPFLSYYEYQVPVNTDIKRKAVLDVATGHRWSSVTECALYFGMSRQAVLKAIRKGSPCRGRIVQFA